MCRTHDHEQEAPCSLIKARKAVTSSVVFHRLQLRNGKGYRCTTSNSYLSSKTFKNEPIFIFPARVSQTDIIYKSLTFSHVRFCHCWCVMWCFWVYDNNLTFVLMWTWLLLNNLILNCIISWSFNMTSSLWETHAFSTAAAITSCRENWSFYLL